MSKTIAVLLLASAILAVAPAAAEETPAAAPAPAAPALETEEQKTLYALGVWLSNRVAQLHGPGRGGPLRSFDKPAQSRDDVGGAASLVTRVGQRLA